MKEILKYLRQTNNLTQAQIAEKLNLSRQSYIKYENGSVTPDQSVVEQLSRIYSVSVDFILQNKVPSPSEFVQGSRKAQYNQYNIDESCGALNVASDSLPSPVIPKAKKEPKSYEAYFDGNTVRVLDAEDADFKTGQRFKLVELSEEEEEERRNKSWETMLKIAHTVD